MANVLSVMVIPDKLPSERVAIMFVCLFNKNNLDNLLAASQV